MPKRHIYKKKAPRGPDFLPSAAYTEQSFKNKILGWFKENKSKDDDVLKMYNAIAPNSEAINEEIKSKIKESGKKNRMLITLSVHDGDDYLYLSNMNGDKYVRWLKDGVGRWRRKQNIGSSEGNGICYLCREKATLPGFAVTAAGFKFSTPDKMGFLYNFDVKDFWKSIPVCDDCAENLDSAHSYIERYLQFPRKGDKTHPELVTTSFWTIPNSFGNMSDEMFSKFDAYIRRNSTGGKTGLIAVEDHLAGYADGIHREPFTLTLLFFEGEEQHMDIRALVNDVIPSRLNKLNDIQWDIKRHPLFDEDHMRRLLSPRAEKSFFNAPGKSYPTVKGALEGNWPMLLLQDYYTKRIENGKNWNYIIYDRFYEILDAVLLGKTLSIDVLSDLMVKLREKYIMVREGTSSFRGLREEVLRSLAIYMYLKKSRAIGGVKKMSEEIAGRDVPKEIEKFFNDLEIESAGERAAVATGILVSKTLYVQREERKIPYSEMGKEPFWNKLNDLVIDRRKLQSLIRDSVAKMRQYGRNFSSYEEVATYYLCKAEEMNKMSKDDISFFFTVGVVWGDTIWPAPGNKKHNAEGDKNE